jgi:hypothetical protein
VVEEVRVSGWNVEIRLRIPLDDHPNGDPPRSPSPPGPSGPRRASSNHSLRSLGVHQRAQLPAQGPPQAFERRWCPRLTLLASLPTYEPVPETTSALDPGQPATSH